MQVLLSEASSLTAREHLSVLGPAGIRVEVASGSRPAIARFSRWCRRVVRVPCSADDPRGYLAAIAAVLRRHRRGARLRGTARRRRRSPRISHLGLRPES